MAGFDDVILKISERGKRPYKEGDYERDGIVHCGVCGMPMECRVKIGGNLVTVPCMCRCESKKWDDDKRADEEEQKRIRTKKLRTEGISDKLVRSYTFDAADKTENILRCKKYVDRWTEMMENNNGLLFWGNVGTGKTYAAACIANAVIDMGIPAIMTSFHKILNCGWNKEEIVRDMKNYPLLVIDDLGAERESDYALEIVQYVIDERYKVNKPIIITTNLRVKDLEEPKNMRYKRIYDRVLEMCVPVYFDGPSKRKKAAADKMRFAKEIFT